MKEDSSGIRRVSMSEPLKRRNPSFESREEARATSGNARYSKYREGDMVWGKVKSHPWWPGQIFNPAFATATAKRYQRSGHMLVAFFGDCTFGWFTESNLVPFDSTFEKKSKQTSAKNFVAAVEDAVDELSRRAALGLTCTCLNLKISVPREGYFEVMVPGYEASSIYPEFLLKEARNSFRPKEMLDFLKEMAVSPWCGKDLQVSGIKAAAQARAYRSAVVPPVTSDYCKELRIMQSLNEAGDLQHVDSCHKGSSGGTSAERELVNQKELTDTFDKQGTGTMVYTPFDTSVSGKRLAADDASIDKEGQLFDKSGEIPEQRWSYLGRGEELGVRKHIDLFEEGVDMDDVSRYVFQKRSVTEELALASGREKMQICQGASGERCTQAVENKGIETKKPLEYDQQNRESKRRLKRKAGPREVCLAEKASCAAAAEPGIKAHPNKKINISTNSSSSAKGKDCKSPRSRFLKAPLSCSKDAYGKGRPVSRTDSEIKRDSFAQAESTKICSSELICNSLDQQNSQSCRATAVVDDCRNDVSRSPSDCVVEELGKRMDADRHNLEMKLRDSSGVAEGVKPFFSVQDPECEKNLVRVLPTCITSQYIKNASSSEINCVEPSIHDGAILAPVEEKPADHLVNSSETAGLQQKEQATKKFINLDSSACKENTGSQNIIASEVPRCMTFVPEASDSARPQAYCTEVTSMSDRISEMSEDHTQGTEPNQSSSVGVSSYEKGCVTPSKLPQDFSPSCNHQIPEKTMEDAEKQISKIHKYLNTESDSVSDSTVSKQPSPSNKGDVVAEDRKEFTAKFFGRGRDDTVTKKDRSRAVFDTYSTSEASKFEKVNNLSPQQDVVHSEQSCLYTEVDHNKGAHKKCRKADFNTNEWSKMVAQSKCKSQNEIRSTPISISKSFKNMDSKMQQKGSQKENKKSKTASLKSPKKFVASKGTVKAGSKSAFECPSDLFERDSKREKEHKASIPQKEPQEPMALSMKFPRDFALPSEAELKARFVRFGQLDISRTRIYCHTSCAQVVFKCTSDAEAAYKHALQNKLFGQANVKFRLKKIHQPNKEPVLSVEKSENSRGNVNLSERNIETFNKREENNEDIASIFQLKAAGNVQLDSRDLNCNIGDFSSLEDFQSKSYLTKSDEAVGTRESELVTFLLDDQHELNNDHKKNKKMLQVNSEPDFPAYSSMDTSIVSAACNVPDISHQMLHLLKKCNDIINDVSSSVGFVPYHYPV